jgi:phosphate transport system protein
MATHLQREIQRLKKKTLAVSALVEENLRLAFEVVTGGDIALAARVVEADVAIDLAEVEVEEECLKLLALYQPVAGDLRFIVAAIKINATLERVGDLGVNVAEHAARMAAAPPKIRFDLPGLIDRAMVMFSRSLDALMRSDPALARLVLAADDEVDALDQELNRLIRDGLRDCEDCIDGFVSMLFVARYIERLADHATNIAEDVIYMTEGEIPRHQAKRLAAEAMGLGADEPPTFAG